MTAALLAPRAAHANRQRFNAQRSWVRHHSPRGVLSFKVPRGWKVMFKNETHAQVKSRSGKNVVGVFILGGADKITANQMLESFLPQSRNPQKKLHMIHREKSNSFAAALFRKGRKDSGCVLVKGGKRFFFVVFHFSGSAPNPQVTLKRTIEVFKSLQVGSNGKRRAQRGAQRRLQRRAQRGAQRRLQRRAQRRARNNDYGRQNGRARNNTDRSNTKSRGPRYARYDKRSPNRTNRRPHSNTEHTAHNSQQTSSPSRVRYNRPQMLFQGPIAVDQRGHRIRGELLLGFYKKRYIQVFLVDHGRNPHSIKDDVYYIFGGHDGGGQGLSINLSLSNLVKSTATGNHKSQHLAAIKMEGMLDIRRNAYVLTVSTYDKTNQQWHQWRRKVVLRRRLIKQRKSGNPSPNTNLSAPHFAVSNPSTRLSGSNAAQNTEPRTSVEWTATDSEEKTKRKLRQLRRLRRPRRLHRPDDRHGIQTFPSPNDPVGPRHY